MNTQQLTPNCKDIAEINKNQGIPHGWKQVRFKDCIEIANGQVDPKIEPYCNMKHVGLENIEKFTGRLLFAKLARDENLTSGKYLFNEGDVLYGKIRPELSKVYLAEFEGICSADIYPLKPKKDIIAKFLKYILLDHRFFRYAVSVSARTGLPKINRDDLGGFKIHVPPIREQQKIADILSTWDKAIELKEKLIEQKKEQKKGLMQRLLTGKVRLPRFEGEWEKVKLGYIIKECKEQTTKNNEYPVLTSSRKGLFLQEEYFSKQVASDDNTGYKIVRKGDFTYRTMSDDGDFVFNQLENYEIGIVSPAYAVFRPTKVNSIFLRNLLNSYTFKKYIKKVVQGGTRLSFRFNDLKEIKVLIPSLEEQNAIGDILLKAEEQIALMEQELFELKQQKKCLMQLLLTGKVRVKC